MTSRRRHRQRSPVPVLDAETGSDGSDSDAQTQGGSTDTDGDSSADDATKLVSTKKSNLGEIVRTKISQSNIEDIAHKRVRIFDFQRQSREHRPFFLTYFVTLQFTIMTAVIIIYPTAQVTFKSHTTSQQVFEPTFTPYFLQRETWKNFYIGPPTPTLVKLGAKYAPCMRPDKPLQKAIDRANLIEKESFGCCKSNVGGRCYNSNESSCTSSVYAWANKTCWSSKCCTDSSKYPECIWKPLESLEASQTDCMCHVLARPCCYGIYGQCSIMTESECSFQEGTYHHNSTLCGDVDCMAAICGLGGFAEKNKPDQWYRLFLAPSLSVGVIHCLLMLVGEMVLGFELERVVGWWRFGPLFLISTIGGYLFSGIFTPYQVQCGALPGLYGLVACLLVELAQSWHELETPKMQLGKVFVVAVIAFLFGLLPYIDNFANIGGFMCGGVAGVGLLPWYSAHRWGRARRQLLQVVALVGVVVLLIVLGSIFFSGDVPVCSWCEKLNCIDFSAGLCKDMGQRVDFGTL
eukprot:m.72699 g.72699  ORF g.72699 m.72699 type:complete len:519 (+) comp24481_c0_seq1:80-1636(+)